MSSERETRIGVDTHREGLARRELAHRERRVEPKRKEIARGYNVREKRRPRETNTGIETSWR